jgi:hypothetical protein
MVRRSRRTWLLAFATLGIAWAGFAQAVGQPLPEGRRVALRGYDPVAYFMDGKPMKGSPRYWYSFDDAVYTFRSADHRARFAAAPERYAPQYSGYCAAGVSEGHKQEPDPEAWIIANGKLFVFHLKEKVPEFRKRIAEVAAKADGNWPSVRKQ